MADELQDIARGEVDPVGGNSELCDANGEEWQLVKALYTGVKPLVRAGGRDKDLTNIDRASVNISGDRFMPEHTEVPRQYR